MKNIYKIINGKRIKLDNIEYNEHIERQNNLYSNISYEEKIKNLKNKITNEIYSIYPIYKQLDIIGKIGDNDNDDYINMKKCIESKIQEYREEKNKLSS